MYLRVFCAPGENAMSLITLLVMGCNLGPGGGDDDTGEGPGNNNDGGPSIADIQDGTIADGETVTLSGVLVSSPASQEDDGFFIQSPGGGEWSGIFVYMQSGVPYLEPGDEITVTGSVSEFYDWTELSVSDDSAIEVTGNGTLTVDSVDVGSVTDFEPWESTLIAIGSATATSGINSYGEIELDNGLKLDNLLFDYSGEAGATWTNVIGPLAYNYSEWKLNPRDAADLEGYVAGSGGGEIVTISDIQDGTVASGSTITVENAFVTTPTYSYDGEIKGFWIADAAGAWNGIYVYEPGFSETVTVGATIAKLDATVDEYYDLTELKDVGIEWGGDSVTISAETLASAPADWEAYEGVLVTIEGLEVTAAGEFGEFETSWDGLNIDDLFFTVAPDVGTTYDVTGVINYSYSEWKLCPRTEADISET